MNIKKIITNLLNEHGIEANPLCLARVIAAISFVSYLAYAVYGILQGHYDIKGYADGLMATLTGSGAIILGKNISER
jgi:hypothetical protein